MNRELARAVAGLRALHGLTVAEAENIAAMLLLDHYGHAIPDFDDKEVLQAEIDKDGPKLRAALKRRKQAKKRRIERFMRDNIMVR